MAENDVVKIEAFTSGRIAVIQSEFNSDLTTNLYKGFQAAMNHCSAGDNYDHFLVPGAFEIPLLASTLAKSGKYSAIVTLGVIIKGDTDHYAFVSKEVSDGIMRVMLDNSIPIIFEVLMVNSRADAVDRSNCPIESDSVMWQSNKGYIAGVTAIKTINLYNSIKND